MISDKDYIKHSEEIDQVFKLLEIQHSRYSDNIHKTRKQFRPIIQFIKSLQAIEKFVLDIASGKVITQQEYEKLKQLSNSYEVNMVNQRFKQLAFMRKLQSQSQSMYKYSQRASIFFTEHESIKGDRLFLGYDNLCEIQKKEIDSRFFDLINRIQSKLPTIVSDREIKTQHAQDATYERVRNCFATKQNIFTLCIELGYPCVMENGAPHYSYNNGDIIDHRNALYRRLSDDSDVVEVIGNIGFNVIKGYWLYCIILFKHDPLKLERDWEGKISWIWSIVTQNKGCSAGVNQLIRDNFSKNAVGLIRAGQTKKQEDFYQYVVRYFILSSLYLDLDLRSPDRNFKIQLLMSLGKNLNTSSHIQPQKHSLKSTSTDKSNEARWEIKGTNFNTLTLQQLKDIAIIYSYIKSHFNNSCFLDQQTANLIDVLTKIETFVIFVWKTKMTAFDYPSLEATLIGRQLQDIFNIITLASFNNYEIDSFSLRVQMFYHLWDYLGMSNVPNNEWSRYEDFVKRIRAFREYTIGRLLQEKMIRFRSFHEQNHGGSLLPISHKVDTNKSVGALITDNYRTVNRTLNNVRNYVKALFKKDVILIDLKFKIGTENNTLSHSTFSKIFTDFMRRRKNVKPLTYIYGYLGRWESLPRGQQAAHVILFMNPYQIGDLNEVIQEINEKWGAALKTYNFTKKISEKLGVKLIGEIQTSMTFFNLQKEFNHYYSRIDCNNQSKQKIFLENILPCIVKSELYFNPNTIAFPKGLIKGSIRTAAENLKQKNKRPPKAESLASTIPEDSLINTSPVSAQQSNQETNSMPTKPAASAPAKNKNINRLNVRVGKKTS